MSKKIYSLQWSAVENAQTYRVFRSLTEVGNKQELVLTSKTSLELNQYIPGSSDYYYFIKAQATGYQDSDYSTPLRWKTFSISRSVDAGVIETTDDSFVGEGFGYNTGFVAPGGKIFNRAVCLLTIGGIQHPEYISFSTDDKSFNIDIPAEAVTGDIVYSAVVQDEITQLATPTIAMNADGKTLEITDVENATSYDVYVDGTLKTNVASVPNTTTVDLSTLSDIADGTHTVKVKAKADGYRDSEFSNEVSYTKAASGQQFSYMKFYTDATTNTVSVDVYFYNESNEQVAHVEFWRNQAKKIIEGYVNDGDVIQSAKNSTTLQLDVDFKAVRCTVTPSGTFDRAFAGYDYQSNSVYLTTDQAKDIDLLNWGSTFAVSIYR